MNKYPAFSTLREIILRGVCVCVNTFSKNSPERIRLLFCTGKWLNGLVGLRLIPFVGCLLPLTPLSLSLVVSIIFYLYCLRLQAASGVFWEVDNV